jgi:hypothetical protein
LIHKLAMKNRMMLEEILEITNKYALAEEVTLDAREQRKEVGPPGSA